MIPYQPDITKIEAQIELGYISKQRHPTLPLYIYNYTHSAQFDRYWTEETIHCRGLILDEDGGVVARPFPKIFNFEEHYGPLPDGPYEVWKKYDGSLGILYHHSGRWHIATRGSFNSDQATEAMMMFIEQYWDCRGNLDPAYTYMVEIIYPGNRIVCNYGDTRELRLLAAIHTELGYEQPPDPSLGFPVAESLGVFSVQENPLYLKDLEEPNAEGFVLRYLGPGLRLKVKFDEYLRLHRIVTNTSSLVVWEHLREGRSLHALLDHVPDEFYKWVRETADGLQAAYRDRVDEVIRTYESHKHLHTNRHNLFRALYGDRNQALVMLWHDMNFNAINRTIWRDLRPTFTKPFATEEE